MPLIPLPQRAPLPDVPNVAGGVARAPTADNRGLLAGIETASRANRAQLIPLEPFMAPGRGMQAIGQGMQQAADPLVKLATARAEAQNDLDVAGAQNALAVRFAQFEGQMQKLPPQEWEAAFAPIGEQAVSEALQDEKLSPAARQRIELYGKRWLSDAAVRVMTASTVEIGQRAEAELFANVDRSIMADDFESANRQLAEIKASGKLYVDPRKIVRYEADVKSAAEAKAKQDEFNTQFDAIKQDARGWLAANPQRPENMDAAVYDRLVSEAKAVDREAVAGDWMRFEEAVESGSLKVAAEVMDWEKDNPRITPAMRREAAASLFRRNDAVQKEIARANAPENMARLVIEARSLNPETDSDEKFSAIQNRIAELPEGYRQLPRDILTSKWRNREKLDEPSETARSLGLGIIKSMFDRGMMGSFDNGTGKDRDGNPVEPGSPDEVHTRDPNQFENAKVKAADLGGKFVRWHNLNPQATPEEIQKKVYELLPEGTRARVLDRLDSLSAPGIPGIPGIPDQTAAGTGDNIDLPGGGGQPSGPGIMPSPGAPPPQSGLAVWVADKTKSVEVVPMTSDDIDRWKSAGETPSEVWDSKASKFVTIPPSKLIPGRHFMPASGLLPQ